jgi:Tol biopolymer transport system component
MKNYNLLAFNRIDRRMPVLIFIFFLLILNCTIVIPVAAVSLDNTKIVFDVMSEDGVNCNIYVMNADGTGQTRLTDGLSQNGWPAWSPDGTKIVFASSRDTQPGDWEIYVMNADGTGMTRLTKDGVGKGNPTWSPDGTKIAFSMGGGDSSAGIYVMNADGTGMKRLTKDGMGNWYPAWSPDGTKIAYASDSYVEGQGIYVMNTDGTGQTRISPAGEWSTPDSNPAWSPDGTKIAFNSYRYVMNADGTGMEAPGQIYIMNADGTGLTRIISEIWKDHSNSYFSDDMIPTWSPDGTKIAFMSRSAITNWNWQIYVMNADGTRRTPLSNRLFNAHNPDWGPAINQNVNSPRGAIQDVITEIKSMNLPKGTDTSIISKLDNAIKSLDKGNTNAAKNQIEATINEITAQKDKKIAGEQANTLIAALQKIIEYL